MTVTKKTTGTKKSAKIAQNDSVNNLNGQKMAAETPENEPISVQIENRPSEAMEPESTKETTEAQNGPENANAEAEFSETPAENQTEIEIPQSAREEEISEQDSEKAVDAGISETETDSEEEEISETESNANSETETAEENDLDSEPEIQAAQQRNECPRCKHVSGPKTFIFPGVNRQSVSGRFEGKPYQIIETRRVKCEKCGQVHFVKSYK